MTQTVQTADLDIGYETWGILTNPAVIFLHGFPDDATSWNDVGQNLADRYWGLAPYARGIGPTRFLRRNTPRSGQLAASAADVIDFADALGIRRFALVGQDWGQWSAQAVAALHSDRVIHLISIGDYALKFNQTGKPSFKQLLAFRFHILMNTPLAEFVLTHWRRPLFRHLWRSWSPKLSFDLAAFNRVAASFDNPDFEAIVLSKYRQFSGKGVRDPKYAEDEEKLAAGPRITVPTTVIRATQDGLDLFDPSRSKPSPQFTSKVDLRLMATGHVPQREQPKELAKIIADALA